MRFTSSPLAVFAAFAFGIEAVVGYVLGMSNGLSELHKTILVGFVVGFPLLSLLTFLPLAVRETRRGADLDALSESYAFPGPADLQAAE